MAQWDSCLNLPVYIPTVSTWVEALQRLRSSNGMAEDQLNDASHSRQQAVPRQSPESARNSLPSLCRRHRRVLGMLIIVSGMAGSWLLEKRRLPRAEWRSCTSWGMDMDMDMGHAAWGLRGGAKCPSGGQSWCMGLFCR